jgi:hypothetical protein
MEFVIPSYPEDLLLSSESYYVDDEYTNVDSLSDSSLNKLLDGNSDTLCNFSITLFSDVAGRLKKANAINIVQHENFDPLFAVFKYVLCDL